MIFNMFRLMAIVNFLIISNITFSQTVTGMMIYQIDGNRYIRKNYNKNGVLEKYETIEVGKVKKENELIESEIIVNTYGSKNDLQKTSKTVIRCNPLSKEVLMGVFPFASVKSNKSLRVEVLENVNLYPTYWKGNAILNDYNFLLKIDGGAAGFFGTESKVSLTQRKLVYLEDNLFEITGKMVIKAFIAGIRITTIVYDYSEEIEPQSGIVKQIFTQNNGAYFTIERIMD